ncbi:MAG: protein kinase [Deltaproteobacteria bacterium]|nr:protein kinase [Deltaproteobacteria bacterium]
MERTLSGLHPPAGESKLGRYQLIYRIGSGGMADVFLARETGGGGLERWVAIKRMHRHLASQPQFVQMLLDEARLAGRIAHPNVGQVLEIGDADGVPFLVMEYLHGEPLSFVLRRALKVDGKPPIDLMVRIIAWACEGAHAAHELRAPSGENLNLVHRDLSPQNVFVTYDGAAKVVDFGVAKAKGRSTLTEPGTLKGKFSYMSPEQARGQELDRRSDVFSLGSVLYKATTGMKAFGEEADLIVLARVQKAQFDPPSRHAADFPPLLEAIIRRALADDRDKRYPTARELGQALELFLLERRVLAGPAQVSGMMNRLFAERIREREALLAVQGSAVIDLPLEVVPEEGSDSPVPSGDRSKSGISVKGITGQPDIVEMKVRTPISVLPERSTPTPPEVAPPPGVDIVVPLPAGMEPRTPAPALLPVPVAGVVAFDADTKLLARQARSARIRLIAAGLALGVAVVVGLWVALRPSAGGELRSTPLPPGAMGAHGAATRVALPPLLPRTAPATGTTPGVVIPGEPPSTGQGPVESAPAPRPSPSEGPVERVPPPTPGVSPNDDQARASVPAGHGFLNVRSQPWANVFIDGRAVRPTPIVGLRVSAGMRVVRLVTQDGRTKTRRVNVTANRATLVDVRF